MRQLTLATTLAATLAMSALATTATTQASGIDVQTLGIPADGKTNATPAIQAALDSGKTDLYFPSGDYHLSPLKLPSDTRLVFSPKARVNITHSDFVSTETIPPTEPGGKKRKVTHRQPLFIITGDRVHIEGLRYDYATGATEKSPYPVWNLVHANGVKDLTLSGIHVDNTSPVALKRGTPIRLQILHAENSRNITLSDSSANNITHMLWSDRCANVTSRGNRMTNGNTITTFARGGESLRHHDNWSRQVKYQCVWRGGSPDPSRKHPRVPHGTANIVYRGLPADGEPERSPHVNGSFDVLIQNNYSEYGIVLCWGNKGRQVIIDGNIARFMWDYSYGSEGGENVIFSNNISINSAVAGFESMYWSEKLLITGNLILVRHEPFDPTLTERPESTYFGQFIRLHHGPHNPEDKYGVGSATITNNLFVNELADRPSGISIEAGRDVLVTGNKIINGLLRKADELSLVKETDANRDMDEFVAQRTVRKEDGVPYRLLRWVGTDASRVTVTNNEFILRQPGDKPAILINGTTSNAIIKDNIIRKETTYLTFTDAQRETEKGRPRFMMYSEDDFANRDLTCATPATAIGIDPITPLTAIVQGNIIQGWPRAITAQNTTPDARQTYIITGNTTDGTIQTSGPDTRTTVKNDANITLPPRPLIPVPSQR
ncbi:right-handed parallel beta-helix repeat-containing protein [Opitutaceae bacterium TAV4]|nr:right-handed parallel beta-helix repeat-containing protein [Opitutaceae bacterium TAV4]RRK02123.1 right-handed parallel beta-helix repeat-containing protein [Opitutaceae bacterium TAV3]